MDTPPQQVWRIGDPAPPPLPPRSEADVTARWVDGPPRVSILCATYQHVGFIEDALRGFLGQETDFPFEIIVRDDASSDGTADIVSDYATRYPGVVRAVLETVNTYATTTPSMVLTDLASGTFYATCEGDDYWIDPWKVTSQVEVLSAAEDVHVVGHSMVIIRDGRVAGFSGQRSGDDRPYRHSGRDLQRGERSGMQTACILYRATMFPELLARKGVFVDTVRDRWFGNHGDAIILPAMPATVYRVHPGGVSHGPREPADVARLISREFVASDAFAKLGMNVAAVATAEAGLRLYLENLSVHPWRALVGAATTLLKARLVARSILIRRSVNTRNTIRSLVRRMRPR
jgi:hypothetical protein